MEISQIEEGTGRSPGIHAYDEERLQLTCMLESG